MKMAQQENQPYRNRFYCWICQDLLKDPVTVVCGHSYCMNCIKTHWDTEDKKMVYSCPQCRETFRPRPKLRISTMLADIVDQLRKTGLGAAPADHCYAGAEDVACDVCTGSKLKAHKSCLVCLASFCEEHLLPHYQSPPFKKHKLVEPDKNLQENICPHHNKVMDMFCRTDQQCICYLCSVDQHKDHDTVSAAAEKTQKQKELKLSLQKRLQVIEKKEKMLKQEVNAVNRSAGQAVKDSEKILNGLILLLQKRKSEVKQQIGFRQETELSRLKDLQETLQQEITELKKDQAELTWLSLTDNPNQFLLNYRSLSALSPSTHSSSIKVPPRRHFEDVTAAVAKVRAQLQGVLNETEKDKSQTETEVDVLLSQPKPKTREELLRYSQKITLDPNTVNKCLVLSEGNRTVAAVWEAQYYYCHRDRFTDVCQVLSGESLTGRCYWEVKWTGRGLCIAVAYKNIGREGRSQECVFGNNKNSWALVCSHNSCEFYHRGIETKVLRSLSSRVGVYLDHCAGLLSFYDVSDTMTLLHRVQTTFTQPLYAGVWLSFRGTTAEFWNGFAEERIEALLHKIEIQIKHQSTNFGLSLASYIASSWNHDGDPVELLQISDSVDKFRKTLEDNPRFLQDKVKQYFKENTHRLTLSMSPDEAYLEKQARAEDEKLQQQIETLSDCERKEIYEKGLELLAAQSQTQDASSLPALKVCDIEPTMPITPVHVSSTGGVPVQYCEQPTNGLVYFRAMCSLNTLPENLRIYVPLFCNVITRMGSGDLDYRQQAQQMELRTGDMSVSTQVIPDSTELDMYEQGVLLSSSCLERNLPHMFELWSDIFNSPHFDDEERLRVLVMRSAQELANGISYSGHVYAMTRAGRHLTPAGDLQETFGGMEQVKFMKRIAEVSDIGHVIRTLARIKKHLFNPDIMRCAVNATPQKLSSATAQVERFISNIGTNRKERKLSRPNIVEKPLDPLDESGPSKKLVAELNFHPCQMKTFFEMPFPVNFVSKSIRTVPLCHEDYASLCILARMMTAKFLHGEIREKGGAYGGGARMGGGGLFTFYSYRDPNSVQTLAAFCKGVDWAKSGQFTQQDIDEAKLSVFSAVDAPVAPSDKGMSRFLSGVTDNMKQNHRQRLFDVSHNNLVDVAGRYLNVGQRTCGVAILGPENETIKKDPTWITK